MQKDWITQMLSLFTDVLSSLLMIVYERDVKDIAFTYRNTDLIKGITPCKHYILTYIIFFPWLETEDTTEPTTLFQALPNIGPTSCFLCYLLFLQHPLFLQIGPTILCLCFPFHLLLQRVERATWYGCWLPGFGLSLLTIVQATAWTGPVSLLPAPALPLGL